ncbi:choline/carnitine/betaine transport [Actinophytocola algeriensis]|uniref:Choline/carnitine/betaine transport n=1 Tax=Actinophytocola algeriensis TaxID=1768010 RepID=A0A7W7Q920_9PSEU|nr:choline/carnitine/betaine transport [Actinophytocola algeriensis]MBE1474336.1 choline/carnitine/betaine transport [Actinophytocola algeriensis]
MAADRPPRTDKWVFGIAAALMLAFLGWGVFGTESMISVAGAVLNEGVIPYGGWAFVLVASGFVLFAIGLAISRYGRIPLGADREKPEFRTVSWIAMMFSAGMGIGLMFFGVVEPLTHFMSPPPGSAGPASDEAVHQAMATTLFHWTVHPWAIYAVVGLAIAYSTFRRGRTQLFSSVFAPLIGKKRSEGPLGRAIDIMAIFATLFGSAASLGLGALQVGEGMAYVGWVGEASTMLLVSVIAVLTIAFVASAVSGVAKGIQWLSNINMVLAFVLAAFVFVVGPTVLILNLVPGAIGDYMREFAEMSGRTGTTGGEEMRSWLGSWTIFYWAWWISWTPFVGMFIARISRGRSIRQFVAGVILVPSVVSLFWFAIFGGAAIQQQREALAAQGVSSADLASGSAADLFDPSRWVYNPSATSEVMTFSFLTHLPLSTVAAILVIVLVSIFFVSGADAASVVMGTLSQGGSVHPKKPVVVFWGVLMGAVAIVMLLVGDGGGNALSGLQNLTIIVAAPFAIIMVGLCWSLWKDLRTDPLMVQEDEMLKALRATDVGELRKHGFRIGRKH